MGDATTETTEPGDKTEAIQPLAEEGSSGTASSEGQPGDQDATQRLDAVGATDNGGNRPQAPKPTAKEGKGRRKEPGAGLPGPSSEPLSTHSYYGSAGVPGHRLGQEP